MSPTPLAADEPQLVCRQEPEYLAVKIHREYDYWLYIPRPAVEKKPAAPTQLYFWDDAA